MAISVASSFTSSILLPIPRRTSESNQTRKTTCTRTLAKRREAHDPNFGGKLVDENMIVLRKRIHERKMIERNYEPPMEWMEWEKGIYTSYDSIICDVMRFLQTYLMETRPSLALATIGLIALSVPISTALVVFNVLELGKGVLSGIHLIS